MTDEPNAERRAWLGQQLERAAGLLDVTLDGAPVFGWHDRTIGARGTTADGERWLRVVAEMAHWAYGGFWTGNLDACTMSGVPKPQLVAARDWSEGDLQLRAELMTVSPSPVIADDMVLRRTVDLVSTWWTELRHALDTLADHATGRVCVDGATLRLRLLAAFGVDVDPGGTGMDLRPRGPAVDQPHRAPTVPAGLGSLGHGTGRL
ncbi:MAG: hypothetical protein ACRDT0_04590 [Pseudonocardiaceae bacterium]